MRIQSFFEPRSSTLSYVVFDEATKDAVVIDPVMDFDPETQALGQSSVQEILDFISAQGLNVHWLLETHVHADHLTGARLLKEKLGAKTAISARVAEVQEIFAKELGLDLTPDGSQFDRLLRDGDTLTAGTLTFTALQTPGHTPADVTWQIEDALFTGDTLFMPDFGTGRCDFPGGSATDLYASIKKLYALPPSTRIFVGHDYQPGGRDLAFETTVAESASSNKHLTSSTSEADFVEFRSTRDATLNPPRLLEPSLRANLIAGLSLS